jgi:hypothetical protein
MLDFIDNPGFVHELLGAIADYNLAQVREALKHDIDAVYFGDDWGQQHGLIMGKPAWDAFIKPQLERMVGLVRGAGRFQMIHSCGDVDELFDDLIALGLNCFNPFQPEVMDTAALLAKYRGRLAFHGGLSTQRVLPTAPNGKSVRNPAGCWRWAGRAATSSPRRTPSRAMYPWPTSSPSSKKPRHNEPQEARRIRTLHGSDEEPCVVSPNTSAKEYSSPSASGL